MQENEVIKLIFAFKIKYHRLQKKMSYQQLSKETGLSVSYLNDIEKGKKSPKFDKINALAKAFEVSYDYLVSTKASKKLQPIIDLFSSDFIKIFPTENFGVDPYGLFDLFASSPDKAAAFISTLFRITRAYQLRSEHLYLTALRSYQDIHNNYFEDLEQKVVEFRKTFKLKETHFENLTTTQLTKILQSEYGIELDKGTLKKHTSLQKIRSYYAPKTKKLYLNGHLAPAQVKFILGRELAFNFLAYEQRPFVFSPVEINSFETVLNNFKASYFAVALLMPEKEVANDLFDIAQLNHFSPNAWLDLLQKYEVTPEMFMQRLTNILPKHFDLNTLFFLRMRGDSDLKGFEITKELHLSKMHNPYANAANEHYCRRWVSINAIKDLVKSDEPILADCQISDYWQSPNSYLCISFANRAYHTKDSISVTLGLAVDEKLRQVFRFVNSPEIKIQTVNTTCERCSVPDCEERFIKPVILEEKNDQAEILALLAGL